MCKLFYYVLVGGDMSRFSSNTQAQQARLLAYFLAHHTITTLEAREHLDILHPSGRVKELRKKGHNIITTLEPAQTDKGSHKGVGRYTLLSGGDHE